MPVSLHRFAPIRRAFLGALGAGALVAATRVHAQPSSETADKDAVTVDVARADLAARRAILIDIREPHEHATGVAPGARLLPSSQFSSRWTEIPKDGRPVYLVCATQNRSRSALRALRERGPYTNVRFVTGGMTEWSRRGLPVAKP
jgi:rhodanese-related sulfurtransferase